MTGRRLAARLLIAALVVAPISAAAIFIAVIARDTAEVASALATGAGALFLASFFQIGLFLSDVRRLAADEQASRARQLTLARCLKDLSHRLGTLEAQQDVAEPADVAPEPAAQAPVAHPAQRAVLTAAAPPAAIRPAERRILTLPQRWLAGIEPVPGLANQAGDDFARGFGTLAADSSLCEALETVRLMIETGARPTEAFVLVTAPANLTQLPVAMARLGVLAQQVDGFCERFRLGISHDSIRSGGMAQAGILAGLARAGLSFVLTEAQSDGLDAGALRSCNITHVRIDAERLLAQGEESARFLHRCREAGLAVIADDVDDPRLIAELIDLGLGLAAGEAFLRERRPKAGVVVLGDRPPHASPPDLVVEAGDSIRLRAAG